MTSPTIIHGEPEFSLRFDDFSGIDDPAAAEEYLRRWIAELQDSGLQPLIKFTRMLEDHWLGVSAGTTAECRTGCWKG